MAKRAHGANRDANRTVSSSVDAGDVIQLKPIVFSAPAVLHGSHMRNTAHAASTCGQRMQRSMGCRRYKAGGALQSISPRRPGGLEFAEKYAKKLGDCQCVMPAAGTTPGWSSSTAV